MFTASLADRGADDLVLSIVHVSALFGSAVALLTLNTMLTYIHEKERRNASSRTFTIILRTRVLHFAVTGMRLIGSLRMTDDLTMIGEVD